VGPAAFLNFRAYGKSPDHVAFFSADFPVMKFAARRDE
jgi:hypothetical protein